MGHITIQTDKFKESIDFYSTILGLKKLGQIDQGELQIVFLGEDQNSCKIELIKAKKSPSLEGVSIGFRVDDLS